MEESTLSEAIREISELQDDITKLQNGLKDASEFCLGAIDAGNKARDFLEKLKSKPILLRIISNL